MKRNDQVLMYKYHKKIFREVRFLHPKEKTRNEEKREVVVENIHE